MRKAEEIYAEPQELEKGRPEKAEKGKFPIPWTFEWTASSRPAIYSADDRLVCVLSTGTIGCAYDTGDIKALADRITTQANGG